MLEPQMDEVENAKMLALEEAAEEARWMEERLNNGFCPGADEKDGYTHDKAWESGTACWRCGHTRAIYLDGKQPCGCIIPLWDRRATHGQDCSRLAHLVVGGRQVGKSETQRSLIDKFFENERKRIEAEHGVMEDNDGETR